MRRCKFAWIAQAMNGEKISKWHRNHKSILELGAEGTFIGRDFSESPLLLYILESMESWLLEDWLLTLIDIMIDKEDDGKMLRSYSRKRAVGVDKDGKC